MNFLKKRYHLLWLLLLINASYAGNIDSLRFEMAKAGNNQDKRKSLYKNIGNYFHKQRSYDSAFVYYSKGIDICKNPADLLFFYKKIGNVFVDSTNYNEAIVYLNRALEINQKVQSYEDFREAYNLLGMCYGLSDNLDEAIISFKKGLEYSLQLNDSSYIGYSYYNIGLANHFKGLYDNAIENFIKSVEFREAIGETSTLVASLTSLGEIFRLKGDYEKSEDYYIRAVSLKRTISNKETLAYLYSELAMVHKIQNNYDLAFAYIDTAMGYCQEIGYKRGIVTLTSYKADIEKILGNVDEAEKLYKQTIPGYREINFEQGVVQSGISIVEIYIDQGRFNEATSLLAEIEKKAQQNNLLDESTQIAELKYRVNKNLGKDKIALWDLENYIMLKDSLFNIKKEEKILEVETRYQTAKKEKQIELLDKENQINQQKIISRNYLLLLLGTVLLFIVVLAVLIIKRRNIAAELEIEKNRHKLLRSQMNPHFIYNALSAIQNFILQNNPLDSVTYISEFSIVMRRVLESSRSDLVLLKDEIELVKSYLALQKLRFSGVFDYKIICQDEINPDIVKLPPMLSQPFIENAVEHGMKKNTNGDGKIVVTYAFDNSNLTVIIADNGAGINLKESDQIKSHKSFATQITRERIENIKKTLKMNIKFEIESEDQKGTIVKLKIPQKR
ncbi:MAG: tetratricopeptide repeat protein [Candidatus Marinimicrobia bacterium]|nr:tetratricopeptide repeat protein [Candidatus Neomarinimicrobiota bacterium]